MPPPTSKAMRLDARFLVVEDEPKLRDSLTEGLRIEGWSVTPASTATEAKEQLDASEFDLIVVDWMLPDADGLELVRHLRSHGKRIPVLLMTARCGPGVKESALRAGVDAFVAKPFAFTDFLGQIRALLA